MSNVSSQPLKPKVTVKLNYKSSATSIYAVSRPGSPTKPSARLQPPSPTNTTLSVNSVTSSTFRPRAKVSSATTRKVSATNSPTSTPRAASPTKLSPRVRSTVTSPTSPPLKPPTFRPRTPVSTPATPEIRPRILPPTSPTDSPAISRTRSGSSSLHHAASFSAFPASTSADLSDKASISPIPQRLLQTSKSVLGLSDRDNTDAPVLRIRSKVSNLAKSFNADGDNTVATTPNGTVGTVPSQLRPGTRPRARTSSISSNVSATLTPTSPPPQFYPITTASPAANPHRFASSRSPPPRTTHAFPQNLYQAFNHNTGDESISRPRARVSAGAIAKVDPVSIPLPPHSPPASAVSFSSRSSVSRSSASVSHINESHSPSSAPSSGSLSPATQHASTSTDHLKSTLDNLLQYTSAIDDRDSGHDQDSDAEQGNSAEHKVKAAAKSNRKIADLEITNRSLLAINASLEDTKHRQAKEIRDLRRKLRESRLILPPREFRAVKSSLGPEDLADDDDVEDEDEESGDDEDFGDGDETYKRIKVVLDNLLKTGQMALETKASDFHEGGKGGAKVLSAQEVRSWRGMEEDTDSLFERPTSHKTDVTDSVDDSFSEIGDQTLNSEDEVEVITVFSRSRPHSPAPPILITQPT